ncbi:MAG: transcriptional regulator with XRE-family HTH domain [Paracoccaceae bacterium]|jgi:transcriptional regulator with XRE-family HTH domain
MTTQFQAISKIGDRLKSYRLGAGLTPDDIARATGISRAAIYRYESGQPIRVDVLGKIADLLNVSLSSLFGVGSENISSAVTFFERLRQIEAVADQITVLFGPVSYLMTTDTYDTMLERALLESVPKDAANREGLESELSKLMEILLARKKAFRARKPSIVSLISASEIELFLDYGFVGNVISPPTDLAERKMAAIVEVQNIIDLIKEQPIGVQIGIVVDSMPGTSFQILRSGMDAQVAVSPFRLGFSPNVRIGVATITSAQESVDLHQNVAENLWKHSLKSNDAASFLETLLAKTK